MPSNPPENMPRISPNVFYDDLGAALDWLGKAFGFETRMSMPGPDGHLIHAEMQIADGVIMMSPTSDNGAGKRSVSCLWSPLVSRSTSAGRSSRAPAVSPEAPVVPATVLSSPLPSTPTMMAAQSPAAS